MAEVFSGMLSFKNGKWMILFRDEAKQKDVTLFCKRNVFAPDFQPKQDKEIEVYFERDSTPAKTAIKVRAKGHAWTGEESSTQQVDYSRKGPEPHSAKQGSFHEKKNLGYQAGGGEQYMEPEFHNPYNFVAAPPRPSVEEINKRKALTEEQKRLALELCDRAPAGHDRYSAGKYSGKLRVKMKVVTPLLVPDAARVEVEKAGEDKVHKKFPVRLIDGKPHITPTAVKGMLRSAYEAVTNSRLAVFAKHEDRLAFRPEAGQGASVVPVRVDEENNLKKIVFFTGSNQIGDLENDGLPKKERPLCAAWLPRYFNKNLDKYAPKYRDGALPSHGDEVVVWIEKFQHYRWRRDQKPNKAKGFPGAGHHQKDFILWSVRSIARKGESFGTKPQPSKETDQQIGKSRYQPLNEIQSADGIVFISNHNMQNKHDEKVFFKSANAPQPEVLTMEKWKELKDEWRNLIENYQELHAEEKKPPRSLRIGNWSRHILKNRRETVLKAGTLCYAQVKKNSNGNLEVERLFPVMISRQLFDYSPWTLLERGRHAKPSNLTPADDRDQLSPADRVFGFVNQNGQGAYRGQIRIGAIRCESEDAIHYFSKDNSKGWFPLQILGQPKPQQGRFYVAEDQTGKAQDKGRSNRGAGYNAVRALRGRKVYPHHRHIDSREFWFEGECASFENDASDHWQKKFHNSHGKAYFREYLRPRRYNKETTVFEQQRDSQNRSIQGWVRRGSMFSFEIHFRNLSDVELGALLWLLQLHKGRFHRIGGGKPLGFGSVQLALDEGNDIRTGEQLIARYGSLDSDQLNTPELTDFVTAFKTAVWTSYGSNVRKQDDQETEYDYERFIQDGFNEAKFIAAFRRAAEGFADGLPIHYPRARPKGTAYGTSVPPNPEGESYKWFVANSKTSHSAVLHGYVLGSLANDDGLPILPEP